MHAPCTHDGGPHQRGSGRERRPGGRRDGEAGRGSRLAGAAPRRPWGHLGTHRGTGEPTPSGFLKRLIHPSHESPPTGIAPHPSQPFDRRTFEVRRRRRVHRLHVLCRMDVRPRALRSAVIWECPTPSVGMESFSFFFSWGKIHHLGVHFFCGKKSRKIFQMRA